MMKKMKNESYVCKYSLSMRHDSVERKNLMEKTSNKLVDLSIAFDSKEKAVVFEDYLKTGSGREFAKRHF